MQIQHSSRNDDWMTPYYLIDMIKEVLGEIHLDPASSPKANKYIQARRILTAQDDALNTAWTKLPVTVYLNPPGGKLANKSLAALFWKELMKYLDQGLIEHAIFMGFSLEQLAVTQNYGCKPIAHFPICIPSKRIAFIDPINEGRTQPSHSNVIAYVPGNVNKTSLFCEVFNELGCLMFGR